MPLYLTICLLGDFNVIMGAHEPHRPTLEFLEFLSNAELLDIIG